VIHQVAPQAAGGVLHPTSLVVAPGVAGRYRTGFEGEGARAQTRGPPGARRRRPLSVQQHHAIGTAAAAIHRLTLAHRVAWRLRVTPARFGEGRPRATGPWELEEGQGLLPHRPRLPRVRNPQGMIRGGRRSFTDRRPRLPLRRGVRQRRQKSPSWKAGASHNAGQCTAQQPLQAGLIGRQVLVFDRPAGAVPIAGSRLELVSRRAAG